MVYGASSHSISLISGVPPRLCSRTATVPNMHFYIAPARGSKLSLYADDMLLISPAADCAEFQQDIDQIYGGSAAI